MSNVPLGPEAARLLQHGAGIVGASAGFALEYLGHVPTGVGGPIAALMTSGLTEIACRTLSAREQVRIGGASAYAIERISARLAAGHDLRPDNFFQSTGGDRPPSAELFEAVLLKARDAYEEKKVRHMGFLFANVLFAPDVSFATANLLVGQLGRLTYRQLCILALVARHDVFDVEALRRPQYTDHEVEALKREEMDLHGNDLGTLGLLSPEGAWVDKLSTLGSTLHDLSRLEEIPDCDLESIEMMMAELREAFAVSRQESSS